MRRATPATPDRTSGSNGEVTRPQVLAVVARYERRHTNYLHALAEHVDLTVAVSGEADPGSVDIARREGLDIVPIGTIGLPKIRARLATLVAERRPHVIHLGWFGHEQLTVLASEVAPTGTRVVFECRDPLTTLVDPDAATSGPRPIDLERAALIAADAHVFVSIAVRDHLATLHGLDLSEAIIVPQGLAARTLAVPAPKLSATDGRVHIVLVGTASADPTTGRCYLPLIRKLTALGLVVHSHFFEGRAGANDIYRALARELPDYRYHDALSDREGTDLSRVLSSYDLMYITYEPGVITEATLAVVMPAKAASAWAQGAIPVVVSRTLRGVVEWIDAYGLGFVIDQVEDLATIAADRPTIDRATAACVAQRHRFTHEAAAAQVVARYHELLDG